MAQNILELEDETKKHRHKWHQDFCDCPNCGFIDYYYSCECGEVRDNNKKPFK